MKIALGIEYDGSHFHGWQRQPNLATVQGHLEASISKVANESITVQCAGRTDTGVHALSQVVHFETNKERNQRSWVFGVNHHMPNSISVIWAKQMPDNFHARFSAVARRYRYYIYNHAVRPAIWRRSVTWHYHSLNEKHMQQAANYLIGEHDFTSFRALECQSKSPIRQIESIKFHRQHDLIYFDIKANAFLHHMVRNIAGVLIAIGMGNKPPEWAKEVLVAKNRSLGGVTAPPYGLYLAEVYYPEEFTIPKSRELFFHQ